MHPPSINCIFSEVLTGSSHFPEHKEREIHAMGNFMDMERHHASGAWNLAVNRGCCGAAFYHGCQIYKNFTTKCLPLMLATVLSSGKYQRDAGQCIPPHVKGFVFQSWSYYGWWAVVHQPSRCPRTTKHFFPCMSHK